ncbi:Aminomethyltransferase [Paramicrosporidium saccamoebae]|uniref:Aminomethyltransferase n=1 Tax=Paramicrosporidium saccamoebae TaxID=1246581 RepID=A0A2H9TIJ6_9FUNG|nr:Aminomethyltransferase [Paramicrosporidium saccamoebae]
MRVEINTRYWIPRLAYNAGKHLAVIMSLLRKTLLYETLVQNGGKMVPFAGWLMPIQFDGTSVLESVRHTRRHASLFDVSHMLQCRFSPNSLESLMPVDTKTMRVGAAQYTAILNEQGGIIDDAILTKRESNYTLVSNASRVNAVLALLSDNVSVCENALFALQGTVRLLCGLLSEHQATSLLFMNSLESAEFTITRCGYTGEDGFEISVKPEAAPSMAELLLKDARVKLAGLAARDILRLEAGLCLYGHDVDETVTPIEAGLQWIISKSRKDYPGFDRLSMQMRMGVTKKRLGFTSPEGPLPREGAVITELENGSVVGKITSGTFSPHTNSNISMGYVNADSVEGLKSLANSTSLAVQIRGKQYPISALFKAIPTAALRVPRVTSLPTLLLRQPIRIGLRVKETLSGRELTVGRMEMERGGVRARVWSTTGGEISEREMWGGKWRIADAK